MTGTGNIVHEGTNKKFFVLKAFPLHSLGLTLSRPGPVLPSLTAGLASQLGPLLAWRVELWLGWPPQHGSVFLTIPGGPEDVAAFPSRFSACSLSTMLGNG